MEHEKPNFSGGSPYVRSYRLIQSDQIRHNTCGWVVQTEACFYGGQPRHPSQGVEPKRSQILGPYLGPHGLTRATKFGWVTHVRRPSEGRASSGQQLRRPSFQESSAPASPIFLTATKFCMVIKLDEGKIFTGSTAPLALAKIFRDTNDAGSVYGIVR